MTSQKDIEKAYMQIEQELKRWEETLTAVSSEEPKASDIRRARIAGRIIGLDYGKKVLHRLNCD